MTYRYLKLFAVILPTLIIGGFEYIRHIYLLPYLSMSMGNLCITLLTLVISFIFASWMFNTIRRMNERLVQEQAKRAVFEERNRLYRELHDGIAQTLFFLNIQLKQGKIEEAQTAVAEINNDVRQIIFNLRCTLEEGYSLKERINKWLYEWDALTGIDVTQAIDIPEKYFTPAEEVLLFGIIQEGFTNIHKHSKAKLANIDLQLTASGWYLAISDNGSGIQDAVITPQKHGVPMMKERAAQLGADLSISKGETCGTKLLIAAAKERRINEAISRSYRR